LKKLVVQLRCGYVRLIHCCSWRPAFWIPFTVTFWLHMVYLRSTPDQKYRTPFKPRLRLHNTGHAYTGWVGTVRCWLIPRCSSPLPVLPHYVVPHGFVLAKVTCYHSVPNWFWRSVGCSLIELFYDWLIGNCYFTFLHVYVYICHGYVDLLHALIRLRFVYRATRCVWLQFLCNYGWLRVVRFRCVCYVTLIRTLLVGCRTLFVVTFDFGYHSPLRWFWRPRYRFTFARTLHLPVRLRFPPRTVTLRFRTVILVAAFTLELLLVRWLLVLPFRCYHGDYDSRYTPLPYDCCWLGCWPLAPLLWNLRYCCWWFPVKHICWNSFWRTCLRRCCWYVTPVTLLTWYGALRWLLFCCCCCGDLIALLMIVVVDSTISGDFVGNYVTTYIYVVVGDDYDCSITIHVVVTHLFIARWWLLFIHYVVVRLPHYPVFYDLTLIVLLLCRWLILRYCWWLWWLFDCCCCWPVRLFGPRWLPRLLLSAVVVVVVVGRLLLLMLTVVVVVVVILTVVVIFTLLPHDYLPAPLRYRICSIPICDFTLRCVRLIYVTRSFRFTLRYVTGVAIYRYAVVVAGALLKAISPLHLPVAGDFAWRCSLLLLRWFTTYGCSFPLPLIVVVPIVRCVTVDCSLRWSAYPRTLLRCTLSRSCCGLIWFPITHPLHTLPRGLRLVAFGWWLDSETTFTRWFTTLDYGWFSAVGLKAFTFTVPGYWRCALTKALHVDVTFTLHCTFTFRTVTVATALFVWMRLPRFPVICGVDLRSGFGCTAVIYVALRWTAAAERLGRLIRSILILWCQCRLIEGEEGRRRILLVLGGLSAYTCTHTRFGFWMATTTHTYTVRCRFTITILRLPRYGFYRSDSLILPVRYHVADSPITCPGCSVGWCVTVTAFTLPFGCVACVYTFAFVVHVDRCTFGSFTPRLHVTRLRWLLRYAFTGYVLFAHACARYYTHTAATS